MFILYMSAGIVLSTACVTSSAEIRPRSPGGGPPDPAQRLVFLDAWDPAPVYWSSMDVSAFPPEILAVDADESFVVSASAAGTVSVRNLAGHLIAKHRTRGAGCVSWAVDAPSRRAVCAIHLPDSGERPSHEWFDLSSGRARVARWSQSSVVAIDSHGMTWSAGYDHTAWIDAAARNSEEEVEVPARSEPRPVRQPRTARIVEGGHSVAFGAAVHQPGLESLHGDWAGHGLWLMNRRGAITELDDRLAVLDLATDQAGDRLAIATDVGIELWQRTGPSAWARRWSRDDPSADKMVGHNRSKPVVALSRDGLLLAATEGDEPRTIAVYDAITGTRIDALTIGDPDQFVTALAIGSSGAIYAGANTGRVLSLALLPRGVTVESPTDGGTRRTAGSPDAALRRASDVATAHSGDARVGSLLPQLMISNGDVGRPLRQ